MKTARYLTIIFLTIIIFASVINAEDIDYLFVGEMEQGIGKSHQLIYRLKFEDGDFTNIEELHHLQNGTSIFNDLRDAIIIENRYAIAPAGQIFDLQFEEFRYGQDYSDGYLGYDGFYSYYRRYGQWGKRRGVYYFDIAIGREPILIQDRSATIYKMANISYFDDPGFSPDYRYYAFFKWPTPSISNELWIKEVETGEEWIIAEDLHTGAGSGSILHPPPPSFIWLEGYRILTQKDDGILITVNPNGNIRNLLQINPEKKLYASPKFELDNNGNIVYTYGVPYLIDLENRTAAEYLWKPLGYGFEVNTVRKEEDIYFKTIRYMGEVIGEWWSSMPDFAVDENYIALPYRDEEFPGSAVDGIAVWSAHTEQWTKIELDEFNGFLGWISE
ncbi:MAG: hypothetical protein GF310_07290 [candidate division Zixibacteria bacterium]|nr:hypothetical protein [candidate division Zixibacteria bacterium]